MLFFLAAALVALVWVALDDDLYLGTLDLQANTAEGSNPLEATVPLTREGDEFGRLTVEFRGDTLRVNLLPRPDLTARSLELVLYHPAPLAPPPEVALQVPGGFPWPLILLSRTEGGEGTRVAVDDLGIQGQGSTTLQLHLLEQPRDWLLRVEAVLLPADPPSLQRYRGLAELTISEERIEATGPGAGGRSVAVALGIPRYLPQPSG